jgi:hypothetical protein
MILVAAEARAAFRRRGGPLTRRLDLFLSRRRFLMVPRKSRPFGDHKPVQAVQICPGLALTYRSVRAIDGVSAVLEP